jgi:hypothetical protein
MENSKLQKKNGGWTTVITGAGGGKGNKESKGRLHDD